MNFGEWLKTNRANRGWSQQDLADKAGMTKQSIHRYEQGRVPKRDTVVVLARALGEDENCALLAAGFVPETGSPSETRTLPSGRQVHITTPSGEPMEFTAEDLIDLDLIFDLLAKRKERT